MHGERGSSVATKSLMGVAHAVSVVLAAWLLLGDGAAWAGEVAGLTQTDPLGLGPASTLVAFSAIYFLRLLVGGWLFMRRAVHWDEAVGVGLLLLVLHPAMASFALVSGGPSMTTLIVAVALYGLGSFLNTYAEYQRYRYKKKHPDSLYTGGLFKLSRHVNYFGDIVLFTGFALATGAPLALAIPIADGGWLRLSPCPKAGPSPRAEVWEGLPRVGSAYPAIDTVGLLTA